MKKILKTLLIACFEQLEKTSAFGIPLLRSFHKKIKY